MSDAERQLREWFAVHGEKGLMTSSPLTLLATALRDARNQGLEDAAERLYAVTGNMGGARAASLVRALKGPE